MIQRKSRGHREEKDREWKTIGIEKQERTREKNGKELCEYGDLATTEAIRRLKPFSLYCGHWSFVNFML